MVSLMVVLTVMASLMSVLTDEIWNGDAVAPTGAAGCGLVRPGGCPFRPRGLAVSEFDAEVGLDATFGVAGRDAIETFGEVDLVVQSRDTVELGGVLAFPSLALVG